MPTVDLIVKASTVRNAIKRFVIDLKSMEVLSKAPCPATIVNGDHNVDLVDGDQMINSLSC
jgi:nucleotide-binding universal stress UspA family protein